MYTRIVIVLGLLCLRALVNAQMIEGEAMPGFSAAFGLEKSTAAQYYRATLVQSNIPGNILNELDTARLMVQIVNTGAGRLAAQGRIDIVAYGTRGLPGDIWTPQVFRIASCGSVSLSLDLDERGYTDVAFTLGIPPKKGAYALIADIDGKGRQFIGSVVRTFDGRTYRKQFPAFCLDNLGTDVLSRLGVQSVRQGVDYKPTTDPDFKEWFRAQGAQLDSLAKSNITVLMMVGGGAFLHPNQPLGRPRPWLDSNNVMMDTKFDLAWLPSYDADFQKWCTLFLQKYGWPKGPVTAISLWNEPWEGISISGWGADMPRYREMYRAMALGTREACKTAGVKVLVGGCDSHSNALDKLFGDGSDSLLRYFDFVSIHYQGLNSPRTLKFWAERKSPNGRVKIWDTESWVANVDDRVAAVVASNRAAGYDRAMGVYGGNIVHRRGFTRKTSDSTSVQGSMVVAWPVAASVGAAQHFIGDRPFKEMLFKNGLPWVMVFDGAPQKNGWCNPEDGTVVVVGDLGEEYGADNLPFRTARGLAENEDKERIGAMLKNLEPFAHDSARQALKKQLEQTSVLRGATLRMDNRAGKFTVFDFYGNPSQPESSLVVPLDGRGFFLRGNGRSGSFTQLLDAIKKGTITGIEPLATVVDDMQQGIAEHPLVRLTLTNVLNRPVAGELTLAVGSLTLSPAQQQLAFKAGETRTVDITVTGGASVQNNTYPLSLRFDAGRDGIARHTEDIHVNAIVHRTMSIDGDLSDWRGIAPQPVFADAAGPAMTEAAWFPFKQFDTTSRTSAATGFLAYDANNFYFAASVIDSTPDPGMPRFETRNDNEFYYPETCYAKAATGKFFSGRWMGSLLTPVSGKYTLSTLSDDGVRLWVDGVLLIDNWTDHAPVENSAEVAMTAGKPLDILLEYYQSGGGARLRLMWESRSFAKSTIPAGALIPPRNTGKSAKQGLYAEFFSGTALQKQITGRIDSTIDFSWKESELPDPAFARGARLYDTLVWPAGVRRFSYRKDPELPCGNAPLHDNIQIAFNVLPAAQKAWASNPPGVMPGFTKYQCTDYEYALNPVSRVYGGGSEIWRLAYPGMPHKHGYPRQGKTRFDTPVKQGKIVTLRQGNTRIVECSLPWSELPDVKKRLDASLPIKFSFRVNDNKNSGCMELSRNRSVANLNPSFHADWIEHWANEVSFSFEK